MEGQITVFNKAGEDEVNSPGYSEVVHQAVRKRVKWLFVGCILDSKGVLGEPAPCKSTDVGCWHCRPRKGWTEQCTYVNRRLR